MGLPIGMALFGLALGVSSMALLTYLIDEQLIRQLAASSGIRVTDADIDNAIENLRLQNNMTEEQFQQALDAQGFTQAQYRQDLKRQLIRLKVMNERVRSRVNVTEEEVRLRYEQRARESGSEIRFLVSNVLLPVHEVDIRRAIGRMVR